MGLQGLTHQGGLTLRERGREGLAPRHPGRRQSELSVHGGPQHSLALPLPPDAAVA